MITWTNGDLVDADDLNGNFRETYLTRDMKAGESITVRNVVYVSPFYQALSTEGSLDLETGSSQYAYVADHSALSPTGSFTIEGWFNWESDQIGSSGLGSIMIGKSIASGNQRSLMLFIDNSFGTKRINMAVSSSGSSFGYARVNYTFSTATWYHIAAVYTVGVNGTVEFFVNGSSIGSANTSINGVYDGTAQFRIGAHQDMDGQNLYFDGKIQDVRLWNTARSGTDISNLRYKRLTGTETNLSGYWPLNQQADDSTTNGNDLTLSGSPAWVSDTNFVTRDVFKADSDAAATTDTTIGFAAATVSQDQDVKVQTRGTLSGFTGLEKGKVYYVSGTAGGISTTPGSTSKKVGVAISDTELEINVQ